MPASWLPRRRDPQRPADRRAFALPVRTRSVAVSVLLSFVLVLEAAGPVGDAASTPAGTLDAGDTSHAAAITAPPVSGIPAPDRGPSLTQITRRPRISTPTPTATPSTLAPEELTGYVWPLPKSRIHGWFAPREGGFLVIDGQPFHAGIDLATFCGDHVRAAHAGTVLYAGREFDPFTGYSGPLDDFYAELDRRKQRWTLAIAVVIDDGNGYRSVYVHLSKATVKAGQKVRAGDVIGREGATGLASGCHLHYGLIRMDGPWQPVAADLAKRWKYPASVRERVDPMRVLSLDQPGAARRVPGINPHYPLPEPGRPRTATASPAPGVLTTAGFAAGGR